MLKFLCILSDMEEQIVDRTNYNIASVTKAFQLIDLLSQKNGKAGSISLQHYAAPSDYAGGRLCREKQSHQSLHAEQQILCDYK